MATFTITNLTASDVYLGDFYTAVHPGIPLVLSNRSANELPGLAAVQAAVAAGTITFSVTYDADEMAFVAPPNSVQAVDMAPVDASVLDSGLVLFRKPFTAGIAGVPDDVIVYAQNYLPYKLRVVNAWALIATAIGGTTLKLSDVPGGAGADVGTVSSAATGYSPMTTPNASVVLTPGALVGMYIRRSDRGVAGELFVLARRES